MSYVRLHTYSLGGRTIGPIGPGGRTTSPRSALSLKALAWGTSRLKFLLMVGVGSGSVIGFIRAH